MSRSDRLVGKVVERNGRKVVISPCIEGWDCSCLDCSFYNDNPSDGYSVALCELDEPSRKLNAEEGCFSDDCYVYREIA